MRLTIGIPTYNRNELLNQALLSVLQQADSRIDLIIVDNCSPIPVAESAKEVLEQFKAKGCGVRIHRNPVNIGGNCNLMYTLSQLDSGWMWLLGDDDELMPSAISTILGKIENASPDTVLLKFSQPKNLLPVTTEETYTCLDDVGRKLVEYGYDWFDNFMFISTSVYCVDGLRKHMALSFHYAYTCFPHVIPVLLALKDGKNFLNCPEDIIDIERSSKSTTAIDYTVMRLGFCALGEVPGLRELQSDAVPRLSATTYKFMLKHMIIGLCYERQNNDFWSGVNLRIGTTNGGLRGIIFVLAGLMQRWLYYVPLISRWAAHWLDSHGKRPKWNSERN